MSCSSLWLSGVKRTVISDSGAPTPLAHYCQGVLVGDHVYAAGQIASDYRTGVASEARVEADFPYYGSDIQRQTRYILENLKKTFRAAGTDLENVVKAQVFLTDLDDFFYFDQVWNSTIQTRTDGPRLAFELYDLKSVACWGAKRH